MLPLKLTLADLGKLQPMAYTGGGLVNLGDNLEVAAKAFNAMLTNISTELDMPPCLRPVPVATAQND
jgi:hypothetical protein